MPKNHFKIQTEQFDDIRILRYQVPGFQKLPLQQKILIYNLSQAALWGRDIIWDQNYKHNLRIRKTLEAILQSYQGNMQNIDFKDFLIYAKKVFFSNGIHHHYSMDKFFPKCNLDYFKSLILESDTNSFPLNQNQDIHSFAEEITEIIYNESIDQKRLSQDTTGDIVMDSACNYYHNVSQKEAEAFYSAKLEQDTSGISHGLNSTLIKENEELREEVWKIGGKYSNAIEKMVFWLQKSANISENKEQKRALELLIDFYETGDLNTFDEYSIEWIKDVHSSLDIIHGFIEVYGDPLGKKASYESVISIIDKEATKRAKTISDHAIWFEQNSSTDKAYKKSEVKGVNARAVHVVMEAGDCSPATPIGINLPNADWIRAEYGSKSISISNIIDAYEEASKGNGSIQEFAYDEKEIELHEKYGGIASKLHVDLHEIVGHGSGKLAPHTGDPSETLKSYASTIEETRADLVALYFAIDEQLIKWGLMPSIEVGYCEYNSYIRGGLMTQLVKVQLGKNVEESHMRNRQIIAKWVYEKGKDSQIIERIIKEGKTYFVINNYPALRLLFGDLLKEVQRIKSVGDYKAAQHLVETYGVKVDQNLHEEVLRRWKQLKIAPYAGFINPDYKLQMDKDQIIDVKIHYPNDFTKQMLDYGQNYSIP